VGTDRIVAAYLHLLGPATDVEAAGFLGTTAKAAGADGGDQRGGWRGSWPDGLVQVRVEGQTRWLAEPDLDALLAAPSPELVRLIPASDPYLQTRDRDLLVPDPAHRKALWKILGSPGAVLVDGEVAGIWRARQARGAKAGDTLEVTVEPFGRLARATRTALDQEAHGLARGRGQQAATVRVP
jgi:hypothetical protein